MQGEDLDWLLRPAQQAGWSVDPAPGVGEEWGVRALRDPEGRPFLFAFRDAVGGKALSTLAEALLAAGVARSRWLEGHGGPGEARPRLGAVLLLRRLRKSMLKTLEDYAREVHGRILDAGEESGPPLLIFCDLQGRAEVRGLPPVVALALPDGPPPSTARRVAGAGGRPRQRLFSDLGQWMLKRLLQGQLLENPPFRPATLSELAGWCGVSLSTASRWAQDMRRGGFLCERPSGLYLTDVATLLRRLRDFVRTRPVLEYPAVFVLPTGSVARSLRKALEAGGPPSRVPDACLALHSACQAHGCLVLWQLPVGHFYIRRPVEELAWLGMRLAREGEPPDVFVRRASYPESIFRGTVWIGGVPTADLLQCWLDLTGHPVRGKEQARAALQALGLPEDIVRECLRP